VPARACVLTPATAISSSGVFAPGADPQLNLPILRGTAKWEQIHQAHTAALAGLEPDLVRSFGCPWLFLPRAMLAQRGAGIAPHLVERGAMTLRNQEWGLFWFAGASQAAQTSSSTSR